MDFHYELLEETTKEIKNIRFFRKDVEINAEEYEVIHDYDEAYENAFDRAYEELEGHTGNLDSRIGADIMNLLQEINRESRQTIIMVTHSPEAAKSSSRIITVSDGIIA